jgi:hypothetical protein
LAVGLARIIGYVGGMAFHIYHRNGACESNPVLDKLEALYDELKGAGEEHPDVSVGHESGWSLSAFQSGLLVWENVERDSVPRHIKAAPKLRTIELWRKLAIGDIQEIDSEPWQDGYV